MTRVLLASASPARRSTLQAAGVDPLVAVSAVDEDAVLTAARAVDPDLPPADAVLALARAKATDVADRLAAGAGHDVVVLGCDSMLELDARLLGKPVDAADARRRWHAMRGRRGVLHTGHWLIDARTGRTGAADIDPRVARAGAADADRTAGTGATSSTVVQFAELSDAEVDAYVATGEPLGVAGAFTIDGLGGPFVDRVEGDYHGVVGLSLPLLRGLLARLGLTFPDLWRSAGGDVHS